ncbi:MAG: sulfatase [Planctomycetota bacterium]
MHSDSRFRRATHTGATLRCVPSGPLDAQRLVVLVTLLCCAACAREDKSEAGARWVRATYEPLAERPASTEREVARLTAGQFARTWRVARAGRVDEPLRWTDDERARLVLSGEGARLAELPVSLTAADLHRATLELDVPAGESEALRLAFRTKERTRAYTDVVTIEGVEGREHIELDLAQVRPLEGGFDAIIFETLGTATRLEIASLVFSKRRSIAFFPTAHDGPALIHLADEARLGVALDAQHPVALRCEAPRGARLELSYRVGPAAELGDAALVIEGLGSEVLRLPLGVAPRYEWRVFRRLVAEPVVGALRMTLEGGGEDTLACVADAGARVGAPLAAPPTVLLVTSDTHRGELLGLASSGLVRTPALDALARRGLVFTDAMSTSNATNPSHVALMTGLHPRDSRIVTNRDPVARRAVTLAERFSAAGWRTAATFSAFHLNDETSGLGQGFDRYEGPGAPTGLEFDAFAGAAASVRDGALTAERALAHIEDAEGAPLFLWVHVFDAHAPYLPQGEFDGRYQPAGSDPRVHGPGFAVAPHKVPGFLKGVVDPEYPWRQYRALVDYVDHVLTPLLEHPRVAAGIVGFTSDHGESFGERGIWWNHAGVHAATTHVPLVVAWPGAEAARVTVPVSQADLGFTLLLLAGLDPGDFGGRDLRWALEPVPETAPRFALGYHARSAAVDDGRWLLVMHLLEEQNDEDSHTWRPGEVELFDRRSDPRCDQDLVAQELPRARAMRARLIQWLTSGDSVGYKGEYHVKAAIDQALAELGYSSGGELDGSWYDPARGDVFLERYGSR